MKGKVISKNEFVNVRLAKLFLKIILIIPVVVLMLMSKCRLDHFIHWKLNKIALLCLKRCVDTFAYQNYFFVFFFSTLLFLSSTFHVGGG